MSPHTKEHMSTTTPTTQPRRAQVGLAVDPVTGATGGSWTAHTYGENEKDIEATTFEGQVDAWLHKNNKNVSPELRDVLLEKARTSSIIDDLTLAYALREAEHEVGTVLATAPNIDDELASAREAVGILDGKGREDLANSVKRLAALQLAATDGVSVSLTDSAEVQAGAVFDRLIDGEGVRFDRIRVEEVFENLTLVYEDDMKVYSDKRFPWYSDKLRLQSERPISQDEAERAVAALNYAYAQTEGLRQRDAVVAVEVDSPFSVVVSIPSKNINGLMTRDLLANFIQIIHAGSPVRNHDNEYGDAGTRMVDPIDGAPHFEVYFQYVD